MTIPEPAEDVGVKRPACVMVPPAADHVSVGCEARGKPYWSLPMAVNRKGLLEGIEPESEGAMAIVANEDDWRIQTSTE